MPLIERQGSRSSGIAVDQPRRRARRPARPAVRSRRRGRARHARSTRCAARFGVERDHARRAARPRPGHGDAAAARLRSRWHHPRREHARDRHAARAGARALHARGRRRAPRSCSVTAPAAASNARDLVAAAGVALSLGISVALVEQPYRVAGRRSPAPAHQLDAAWIAVRRRTRRGRAARPAARRRRPLVGRARRLPHRARRPAPSACSASRSRCSRRAARARLPRRAGCRARRGDGADAGRAGRARPVRHAAAECRSRRWSSCRATTACGPMRGEVADAVGAWRLPYACLRGRRSRDNMPA